MPVDIVYTWVDGSDPQYLEQMQKHSPTRQDLNPERFRDAYQLLRYSLRSLAQFGADWLGRIFIVTTRPQIPSWLNPSHPQIQLVHHDQFFADPSHLPTFSNLPLESQLQRLPCSDPFLYFNDDYLLGAPLQKKLFVDNRGRVRVFGTLLGERFPWHVRQGGYSLGFTEHTPLWIDKTLYAATHQHFWSIYQKTMSCKFRQDWNYRAERAYRYYLLAHTKNRVVVPFWVVLKEAIFHKITNHPARQLRLLRRIQRIQPPLLCLNDDQCEHPHAEVVAMVQSFLNHYYPRPSPWEYA